MPANRLEWLSVMVVALTCLGLITKALASIAEGIKTMFMFSVHVKESLEEIVSVIKWFKPIRDRYPNSEDVLRKLVKMNGDDHPHRK